MINFLFDELNKFAYLYSKPLGNHTLKIMKKNTWKFIKNLEKSWKYHGILSVRKSGNPECTLIASIANFGYTSSQGIEP